MGLSTMASGFKVATDLVLKLSDLIKKGCKAEREVLDVTRELTTQIFELQSNALANEETIVEVIHKCAELEKQNKEFEGWFNKEKPNYVFDDICPGVSVYIKKDAQEPIGPKEWLCPNCFTDNKKSHFTRTDFTTKGTHYTCHKCGLQICDDSKKRQPNPGNNPRVIWKNR